MLTFSILLLLLLNLWAWVKYKDIKCPAFLFGIPWIIALINLKFMPNVFPLSDTSLGIIGIGGIIFQIGFYLGDKIQIKRGKKRIELTAYGLKTIVLFLLISSIPILLIYIKFIRSSNGLIYESLTNTDLELELPPLFNYYRKAVQYIFLCVAVIYWTPGIEKKYNIRLYFSILFTLALLATISIPTRNNMLFFLFPLVMIWFCTHKTKNKRIIFALTGSLLFFLLIFYIISVNKYWYLYSADHANNNKIIIDELQLYLSGGLVAFSKSLPTHIFTANGENTFRFFYALSNSLFNTKYEVSLVNEFLHIGGNRITNVYTFYDFYLRDFGVLYSLIIQFILSIIHGILYKQMLQGKLFGTFLFSMSSYPLLMQFFQDQYFSLTSTWLQIILIGLIIFKTNIVVRYLDQ